MGVEVIRLEGTTASGTVTVDGKAVRGWLESIDLEVSAADATADVTVSVQSPDSGNAYNVLVVANTQTDKRYYPRTLTHLDTDGSDLAAHTRHFIGGKPRFLIASAGDAKVVSCVLTILTDD